MKKLAILVLLISLTFNVKASLPEGMPQAVYDGIVAQVITDLGHFDAIAVEQAIYEWVMAQPVPPNDGDLQETGNCTQCQASDVGTDAQFFQPRNVKIKAKVNPDGTYPTTLKIKWKRPKNLDDSLLYEVSHYKVYVSKDDKSYEIFDVPLKYKRNGKLKKKQSIKFKDRELADYKVQIQAVYIPITSESAARASSANKSTNSDKTTGKNASKNPNSTDKSSGGSSSGWTTQKDFSTKPPELTVGDLTGAIKTCVNNNSYSDSQLLTEIENPLLCPNHSLQDSDVVQITDMVNLTGLDLGNNPDIISISALKDLTNLSTLLMYGAYINMGLPDFTDFDTLINLRLSGLGLNALPNLTNVDSLEYLDISDNNIKDGFNKLPDSLSVLILNGNKIKSCDGLETIEIETIQMQGPKVTSFENCSEIFGLKNLSILDAPNLIGDQKIKSFGGFCDLSLINTNIVNLKNKRPIYSLTLTNNEVLETNSTIRLELNNEDNSYPHLIPTFVDYTSSNNMSCHDVYKRYEYWTSNNKLDMSNPIQTTVGGITKTSPSCQTILNPAFFNLPSSCKPNELNSLDVYYDQDSYKKYLKWDKNIDHDYNQWGITSYKLVAYRLDNVISQRYLPLDVEQPYILNGVDADKFTIQACIGTKCGYETETISSEFKQGLSRATNLSINWQDLTANKTFKIGFEYPVNLITEDPATIPDYFRIVPNLKNCNNNNTCELEDTIQYIEGQSYWETTKIYNYNNPRHGKSFNVYACNEILGCSEPRLVSAQTPVVSAELNLEKPIELSIATNVYSIELMWKVAPDPQNTVNGLPVLNYVDYFEIVEMQPYIVADQPQVNNSGSFAAFERTFYLDALDVWDSNNENFLITLKRKSVGKYTFKIRSCKRDRVNGDVCSGTTQIPYEKFMVGSNEFINLPYQPAENQILRRHEKVIEKPINIGWFNDNGNIILSWNYPKQTIMDEIGTLEDITYKPDYFFITNITAGLNNNSCIVNGPDLNKFTINHADKINNASTNHENVWTTQIKCKGLNQNTEWVIQACINGIGCSPQSDDVSLLDDNQQQNQGFLTPTLAEPDGVIMPPGIPSSNGPVAGGPGDLLPGMWWNPELSGTGWHFYWANNLGLPSNHENYSNTYDLIGYWLAYREIRGVWTPTWFQTRLKQVAGKDYFEGDITYQEKNPTTNDISTIDTGNLQVLFSTGEGEDSNRHATLVFDIDYESSLTGFSEGNLFTQITSADDLGPYSPLVDENGFEVLDGTLRLEIQDFAIGVMGGEDGGEVINTNTFGPPNDDDHYSGLWQNNDKSVSFLTWIEHNMEMSTVATFDNDGVPIWVQAVNISREENNVLVSPTGKYFDNYDYENSSGAKYTLGAVPVGFNPLSPKPYNHNFQGYDHGYVKYIGHTGRCFEMNNHEDSTDHMRFRKAKFWATIADADAGMLVYQDSDLDSQNNIYSRSITEALGGNNADECADDDQASTMLNLTKQASLHEIRFEIESQNEVESQVDDVVQCQPTVDESCDIKFTWYTDDFYENIQPYVNNTYDPTAVDHEGYDHLSNICNNDTNLADGEFVMENYQCTINTAGTYRFQLHKDTYDIDNNGNIIVTGTLPITETMTLKILPCDDCVINEEDIVINSEYPYRGPNGSGNSGIEISDLPTAPASSSKVGATKGSFSVSNNGAASYSIPIMTAPASGGFAPSFSINYSSQSSTSSLGKGWSIGGYSVINRCSQTYEQDYIEAAADPLVLEVNFTESDRFCVDGKRLYMETDSGTYGGDGVVYKTEINDFTKYTSYGSQAGSPTCFIAQNKNGNTTYYGNCGLGSNEESTALVDSALTDTPSDNPAFAWAQSRMNDVSGNYYDVSYYSGKVAGTSETKPTIEFYPKKVYYSANINAGQSYKDEIEFVYDDAVDSDEIIGNAISTNPNIKHLVNNKRLIRIDSMSNSQSLRSYDLGYTQYPSIPSAGINAYNVLSSITECTDSSLSTCYEPTVFNWDTGSWTSTGSTVINLSSPFIDFPPFVHDNDDTTTDDYFVTPYDINGDGLSDFVINYDIGNDVPAANQTTQIAIAKSDGTGFAVQDMSIPGGVERLSSRLIDINGDGFNDIAVNDKVYLWNGFEYSSPVTLDFSADKFFDLDGDGLPEAIEHETTGSGNDITENILVYKNNIGLDENHILTNAYGEPQIFNLNVSNVELIDGGLIIVDEYPFNDIDIVSFFDDNGDGVSEILLEVEIEACPDGVPHPTLQGDINPCQFDSSSRIYQWAIARLVQIGADDWEYSVKTLEPTTSCSSYNLCGMGITQPTFVDFNQDGSQEMCYIEVATDDTGVTDKKWRCFETVKGKYTDNSIFRRAFSFDGGNENYLNQTSFEDYNGDGFIDLMFSDGRAVNSKWSVIYTNTSNGNISVGDTIQGTVHGTNTIAGKGEHEDTSNDDNFLLDKHLFIDVNNDGIKDSLLFKYNTHNSDDRIKAYATLGTITGGLIDSKDKIVSITEGLGNHIDIVYRPMTDTNVYTRENNSVNAWFGSGKTPIYDFTSKMTLVSEYSIDFPFYDIADYDLKGTSTAYLGLQQTYQYHYYGAKIQAGGRGFLGFKTFEVFDTNNSILNQTSYHQEFPFTGLAYKKETFFVDPGHSPTSMRAANSENKLIPCWVNSDCAPVIPPKDPCLGITGFVCSSESFESIPDGANRISYVDYQWEDIIIDTGSKSTVFVYQNVVGTDQYELDGVSQIGRTSVTTNYEETNFYGNPTQVIEYTYDKGSTTALLTKTTDMDYYYPTNGDYVFNKVKTNTSTFARSSGTKIRNSAYTYDGNHRLLTEKKYSESNALKYIQTEYKNRDFFGNPERVELTATGETMRFTVSEYDNEGRYNNKVSKNNQLISEVDSRDKYGNPTKVFNQQGIASLSSYDAFGGLYYKIDELGQWSQTTKALGVGSYCSGTGATFHTISTSFGPTTWNCFDKLGRTVRTVSEGFATDSVVYVDSHYDISGNLIEKSVPKFSVPSLTTENDWNRSAYDALGRVQKSRNANEEITTNFYSALSVTVSNDLGRPTTSISNMLGELTSVEDSAENITTYEYDAIGNQTSIDGPLEGITDTVYTFYDDFNNVDNINDPNLGIWTYKYNLYGELLYQRNAKHNCTVLTYDDLGRNDSKTYKTSANDTCTVGTFEDSFIYTYETDSSLASFGLLKSESNQKMINTYFYDDLGRNDVTEIKHIGEGIGGADKSYLQSAYYDQHSRPLAQYDATGQSVRYEYNQRGYQFKTIDQQTNTVFQEVIAIDAFGNTNEVKSGNNVTTTMGYDDIGRVKSINTVHQSDSIQSLHYEYDTVGNLESREDRRDLGNVFYEKFTYDTINRLKVVEAQTGSTPLTQTMSFDYDEGGRITDFNGDKYCYSSDSIHGVDAIKTNNCSTGSVIKSFDYDLNGNQTESDGRTIEYTAFNKTSKMYKGATSVDFVYGTNNQRIKRIDVGSTENETTYYVGNVEFIVNTLNGTTKTKRYIGDTVVTDFNGGNQEVKYLHKDHLGSVQSVTNNNYNIITTKHLSYDAFGKRRSAGDNSTIIDENPISNVTKRGFTGQEHIDQLGIINYNARLYDPELGIMLQADTIIPDGPVTQSMNRYSYVFNNPLSYTDPTGHVPWRNIDDANKSFEYYRSSNEEHKEREEIGDALFGERPKDSLPKGTHQGSYAQKGNGLGSNEAFNGKGLGEIRKRYNKDYKPKKRPSYTWHPDKDWDSWINPNLINWDDGRRQPFITDNLELNDLLRLMQVSGGSAEAMLGASMCATVAGCYIGSSLIAYGLNNVYEGAHQKPGIIRQGHHNLFGETAGEWTYLAIDLSFATYGFLKPIDTPVPLGNTGAFQASIVDGKATINRTMIRTRAYSNMSALEVGRDGIVIFNSIYNLGDE